MATKVRIAPKRLRAAIQLLPESRGQPQPTSDTPATTTPCPVCAAPIRSDDCDVIGCTECGTDYHSPCFWRVLPISEWTAFLAWVYETPLEALDRRDYICAACRQLEGLQGAQ
jgi:hypothetical protein